MVDLDDDNADDTANQCFEVETFLNHEATISTLADGLTQVATALPRTGLSLILYPTPRMKRAVAQLYAHIIKFLLRAKSWYEEHWLKHVWHSLSRPVELRFTGLLSDIESLSVAVDNLAAHGSRAEQREMHQKVDFSNTELVTLRGEVRVAQEMIKSLTSLLSSSFVNTDNTISHIQLLGMIQAQPNMPQSDPMITYQYNLSMRNRRVRQKLSPGTFPSYTPALRPWSHAANSSLLVLQCPVGSRNSSKDLAVSIVEVLMTAGVPTLWALDSSADSDTTRLQSTDEVLKYLLKQATVLFLSNKTESAAASLKTQIEQRNDAPDLALLLGACLRNTPVVYIVVDIEAIVLGRGTNNHPK
ncbi:hypothetical protein EDB81DRAFT_948357 [Dactylonectria macrodidyma]|uniref:DUF7708 domain-containing protein n=1 Tax=Dactylonectria macrodidyma TaxID=307937 RepID=A0A9P9EQ87_9HYPO|nr:hypothetical protein EDB81DRAFT_948357 [Dactylonectria macrodidyma]